MVKYGFSLFCCFASVLLLNTSFSRAEDDRKVYVVYMGSIPSGQQSYLLQSHHHSLLQEVLNSREERSSFGFASRTYYPETTRSWDFMGLNDDVKRVANVESDTVVGLIDSGIWPELPSFDDKGFGLAPTKWKGVCKGGVNFTCNNKVIGARFYTTDNARDMEGHGTHTASTAAGNRVNEASFYGFAQGTAKGGVPSARLAIYKACDENGCDSHSILAAFDDAIADGVDILSVSVGGVVAPFEEDPIAIGSFHGIEKGILTLNSGGNSGPNSSSLSSFAPWIVTVAASTTDRTFIDKIELGNGKTIIGSSVNTFSLNGTKYPLVYGEAAAKMDALPSLFRSHEADRVGAIGSIVVERYPGDNAHIVPSPTTSLSQNDFDTVVAYFKSEKNPVAEILKSETIITKIAPIVAQFSSRGPNKMVPDILKPDLTAPGVNILAGFSPAPPLSAYDNRHVTYSLMSGTSMSCPHVAGVAAYVKTFHQDWSPTAIKSALMTTAWTMDASKHPDAEFAYGSGHIDPVKAVNPGLVYDAMKDDYLLFLCGLGYDVQTIRKISGDETTCPKDVNAMLPRDLNSPSLSFKLKGHESEVTFHRTVTNVGDAKSTYKAKIIQSSKFDVKVNPEVLSFMSLKEKKSFTVTIIGDMTTISLLSASLEWSDGAHIVRSPIVLYKD